MTNLALNDTDSLHAWLTSELDRLSLDPQADAHLGTEDYLLGVLVEDLISDEDKVEGMVDFLTMTFADQPTMSTDLAHQFVLRAMAKYSELASCAPSPRPSPDNEPEGACDTDSADDVFDDDNNNNNETPSSSSSTAAGKRVMTKEELKRRKALVQQYGYEGADAAEPADLDPVKAAALAGQLQLPKKKSKRAQVGYDVLLAMPNDNKKKQMDAEQAKRAAMKAQHDAKVARDKAALAKQKAAQAAKEAAKKTVKQEKRRM